MHLCVVLVLFQALGAAASSDRLKVFGGLGKPASLPCSEPCSGELTWTTFQKQDDVLARCTRVSCWHKDGFELPYEQYLRGNSSLTVLKADYSLRRLYMAKCDSKTICNVVFTLSPEVMTRVITPGENIDVYLPLTQQVEVNFAASRAVQPSNLQVCTVENVKIQCSLEYKERAFLLNLLQIKDGALSDSGNYTVRDTLNDETIAIVKVRVREEKSRPDCTQGSSMPAWGIILIAVLVILLVAAGLLIIYLWNKIQKLCEEPDRHQQSLLHGNADGTQQSGVGVNGRRHPGAESSAHTALTDQQL